MMTTNQNHQDAMGIVARLDLSDVQRARAIDSIYLALESAEQRGISQGIDAAVAAVEGVPLPVLTEEMPPGGALLFRRACEGMRDTIARALRRAVGQVAPVRVGATR